jgi:hypothetical protein
MSLSRAGQQRSLPDLTFLYNGNMVDFRYYQPVDVRYGNLDPQGHVNHARVSYRPDLGLWDGNNLLGFGFNLARLITGRVP